MNFVDFTLVRLATPALRDAVFDSDGLAAIVEAAYGADTTTLDGPFQAIFDELAFGVAVVPRATLEGWWNTGTTRSEGRFALSGLGRDPGIRVDALWRGSIVARATPANATIVDVTAAWPVLGGVDAQIIADLGALPDDPIALEHRRRSAFLARIRATLHQPAALTDAVFDEWLRGSGAASVSELLAARGVISAGALTITYSDPASVRAVPRALPVSSAILLRNAPISLVDVVATSKVVLEQLSEAGLDRASDRDLGASSRMVATWLVPESVFDDPDWPGGTTGSPVARRLERRRNAASWLAPQGIAIVTTPAHP